MTNIDYSESAALDAVLDDVIAERQAQDAKWGQQSHADGTGSPRDKIAAERARDMCDVAFKQGDGTWRHILLEEVGEAFAESDPNKLRAELVQVVAVGVAWIQAIDRNNHTAALLKSIYPPIALPGALHEGLPE